MSQNMIAELVTALTEPPSADMSAIPAPLIVML